MEDILVSTVVNLYDIADKSDFQVIAQANNLSKQWFKALNQKKGTFISFVGKLSKDPESLLNEVSEDIKLQFYNDLPSMLIPLVMEEELIKNSNRIIYNLIHKLKIEEKNQEDAYAIGLMAFRNAIWYYTKPDVLFTTYAYIAVKSKLQEFKRVLRMQQKQKNTVCEYSSLPIDESFANDNNRNSLESLDAKSKKNNKQFSLLGSLEKNVSFEYLINNACYDETDRKIIRCYLQNRKKWVEKFIDDNPSPRTGKKYCRWAIHKRVKTFSNIKLLSRMHDGESFSDHA
jgi:hypothetical protein